MDAVMSGEFDTRTLKRRTPVWAALSDLFLDTDVSMFYAEIAETLRKSRYRADEIERMIWEEVGPAFYTNVIAEDRAWSAWPTEHVREIVLDYLSLSSLERYARQRASVDVVGNLIDQHWHTLQRFTWGASASRPTFALPSFQLPRIDLPRLPQVNLPQVNLAGVSRPVLISGFVAALVFGLIAYEAFAVLRAQARTPEVLQQAWAQAGPPLSRELPVSWLEALMRVEDPGFRRHRGVDFQTPGQGWTTITQALVKRLYFDRFTPGFGKIEQSLIARFVLSDAISKDEQLDLFLSLAYFGTQDGRDIIGFRSAAVAYYGRALGELDSREFLSLVAMLPAPNELRPGTARNNERVARIERLIDGACAPSGWGDVWLDGCAAR